MEHHFKKNIRKNKPAKPLKNNIRQDLEASFCKVIEKLNIEFLKMRFSIQSQFVVKNYTINLNSKEVNFKNKKLKLTEKEVQTIFEKWKEKKITIPLIQLLSDSVG